jgi:serine/threonine protein kinase
MKTVLPNPGHGYIVRELLGRGRWKEVYRAVVRGEWRDRALARFIKPPNASALFDELRLSIGQRGDDLSDAKNIAVVYDAFWGDDRKIYLVEELLYRPLDALAPLKIVDRFMRIARDLSNGLAELHSRGKVHRDLKLDNCGIDHSGVAKVFDLGSATSEGGCVQGTTLTRAPELFAPDARCTKKSDIWALAAVLFALRTGGDYPFVTREEAKNRPLAGSKRAQFDTATRKKIADPKAAKILTGKVEREFPHGSKDLVLRMLAFEPSARPTAEECCQGWAKLLKPWIPEESSTVNPQLAVAEDISAFLMAVLHGTAGMSTLQWQRVSQAVQDFEQGTEIRAKLVDLRAKVARQRENPPA